MGHSFKEDKKRSKNHPHKNSRFYKDESHERKGEKPKRHKGEDRRRMKDFDGFDLMD